MKTKITAILTFLAASVFAFAEAPAETAAPAAAPEKAQVCQKGRQGKGPKARPQVTPEQRQAFVRRVLLSLSDEDLAKLANEVEAVRKLTPEEKAEALKALPKPEFRRPGPDGRKCDGKRPAPCGDKARGPKDGLRGPKARGYQEGPRGPKPCSCGGQNGPRGPKACGQKNGHKKPGCGPKGAPLPLPPAKDAPEADAPEAPVEE